MVLASWILYNCKIGYIKITRFLGKLLRFARRSLHWKSKQTTEWIFTPVADRTHNSTMYKSCKKIVHFFQPTTTTKKHIHYILAVKRISKSEIDLLELLVNNKDEFEFCHSLFSSSSDDWNRFFLYRHHEMPLR